MEKTEILLQIKDHLQAAHTLATEFQNVIGNTQLKIHIGAIANKWLGGINTEGLEISAAQNQQKAARKVFTPDKESFKKKEQTKNRVAPVANPLSDMSLSALKVMAKEMGLGFKGRDRKGLIEMISMSKKRSLIDTGDLPKRKKKSDEEE